MMNPQITGTRLTNGLKLKHQWRCALDCLNIQHLPNKIRKLGSGIIVSAVPVIPERFNRESTRYEPMDSR
jgi:hypothetical protein